jgi:hypothetical protein
MVVSFSVSTFVVSSVALSFVAAAARDFLGEGWSDQISSMLSPASYRVNAQWKK